MNIGDEDNVEAVSLERDDRQIVRLVESKAGVDIGVADEGKFRLGLRQGIRGRPTEAEQSMLPSLMRPASFMYFALKITARKKVNSVSEQGA